MSIYYRDKNGARRVVAGMTPGGDLAYGASTTRSGSFTVPALAAGAGNDIAITFSDEMPDADYCVTLNTGTTSTLNTFNVRSKTKNGFYITVVNNSSSNSQSSFTANYTAFKLYEVSEAEQNASDIADIKSYIPATTSSSNKLVNQSDLSSIEIDKLEDINDVNVTGIQDGDTIIWDNTNSEWVPGQSGKTYTEGLGIDIDSNDEISVDQTYVPTTFVGSTAEWNALSTTEKAKYNLVSLNDDSNGTSVVDAVTDGDMRPVTSNAVYDAFVNTLKLTLLWTNPNLNAQFAAQDIALDLSDYDFVMIRYTVYLSQPYIEPPLILEKGEGGVMTGITGSSGFLNGIPAPVARVVTFANTADKLTFGDGLLSTQNAAFTSMNSACLPWKIYGIKLN